MTRDCRSPRFLTESVLVDAVVTEDFEVVRRACLSIRIHRKPSNFEVSKGRDIALTGLHSVCDKSRQEAPQCPGCQGLTAVGAVWASHRGHEAKHHAGRPPACSAICEKRKHTLGGPGASSQSHRRKRLTSRASMAERP